MHQHVEIIGYLGAEPDLRYTQGGTPYCTLNVATSKSVKINDKWEKKTTWFRVKLWGNQAKNAADWLHKGSLAHFYGEIETSTWRDNDGNERHGWELKAFRFNNMRGASQGAGGSDFDQRRPGDKEDFDQSFSDDDIPF